MGKLKVIEQFEDFGNRLIKLLNSHLTYYQIAAFEQVISVLSYLIAKVIIAFTLVVSSLFISIWLSFFLGELIGKTSLGFLAVGLLMAVLGWIVYLNRKTLFIDPLIRELSKVIEKQGDYEKTE